MTVWLAAFLLVAAVMILGKCFGVITQSRAVLSVAEESIITIGNRMLDDDAKETALQRQAFRLFKLFGLLVVGGAGAFLLPLGALRLADRLGAVREADVLAATLSWPFLAAGAAATLGMLAARRGRPRGSVSRGAFENRYSTVDRWLHHLAFAGGPVQLALSRVEDRRHGRRLACVRTGHPVFITALPRAGTTLLLNLCARREEFVAHTYRRMPFVLTPLWWETFSRFFRRADAPRERAHGDGLLVSADSPEALEEILWLNFWPGHYEPTRIRPWSREEDHPEFVEFFSRHIRKLIAASSDAGADRDVRPRRYLSKNNANIARIGWLARAFPEARFVVPFRSPLQHAASLLRQHHRFLEIHRKDPFARHYMAGIGHFDFGANLRPVDFDGWTEEHPAIPATDLEYWLRYWIASYRHLTTAGAHERVRLVDFDGLCASPLAGLSGLADFIEVTDRESFIASSRDIHVPKPHVVETCRVPESVMNEAISVHTRLMELAESRKQDVSRIIGSPSV
jgi:hypothetical protein